MPESQRLYERIAQEIAEGIARGVYAIGQRLPSERDLAQTFRVSRPTVREAMIALELDGLVDVRTGSGVYVTHRSPPAGVTGKRDIGPFELLEARRAIEGEACAMAAARITAAQLTQLSELIAEMRNENDHDVQLSEAADRRFHELIAQASENTAMIAAVEMLWDARSRSPQHRSMDAKVRSLGIKPRVDEHATILEALGHRNPDAARAAMRAHLTQVLEATLQATETEKLEQTRAQITEQRKRYALDSA
jgi:DNA-binding FadR family transcriptional regulator